MKKTLMNAYGADAKTSFSLVIIGYYVSLLSEIFLPSLKLDQEIGKKKSHSHNFKQPLAISWWGGGAAASTPLSLASP
jgi:hypothetical protein